MDFSLNTGFSDLKATADTDFPPGCGCEFCCNGGQRDPVDFNPPINDLVILPGGGGTVTPASIGVNNASHLIHGFEWGPGGGTAASVTFSFPTSVPSYYAANAQERTNFQPFTSAMQDAAREVMGMLETFANLTLTEVSGVGDIIFGQAWLTTAQSAPGAWAYYPDQGDYGGDIWTNNNFATSTQNVTKGDYGFFVLLHEVGHALGLVHSFTAGLTGNENTEQYSVMAYDWSPWNSVFAQTHMLYDIAALQAIYGANGSYNIGDDVYTLASGVAQTIWDGGGIDTIDTTAVAGSVIIHLEEGGFSSIGLIENVAIAYGTIIENATTGAGNDFLYGNAANNILIGGSGNDQLFGAEGDDSYVFLSGLDMITETTGLDRLIFDSIWNPWDALINGNVISLLLGIDEITFNNINLIEAFSFDGFADMTLAELIAFELVTDDIFIGTPAIESFDGGTGNDTADYSGSALAVSIDLLNNTASGGDADGDTLTSIENITGSDQSSERDWIWGDANANTILGLAGNDILEGGGGADTIDGGLGWDYSRYTRSASGININLETGVNTGGDAEGDILIGIEAIVGSSHDDVIIGAVGSNFYKGEGGNDTITGSGYNDQIFGGSGNDTLNGNSGNDTLRGESGDDLLYGDSGNDVYYYTTGQDTINETTGTDRVVFSSSWNPTDATITGNILAFTSTNQITFNDITLIEAFGFADFTDMTLAELIALNPGPGPGNPDDDIFIATALADTFDGGAGNDTVDYSGSALGVMVNLLNGTASDGDAAGDTLTSIENITGSDTDRDWIWGDANANVILGMGGNDVLEGGAGADTINGGVGWDYSRYIGSSAGVNINLETGVNTGGDAQDDIILNIEAIIGSNHNDTITGTTGSNFFKGEGGNDTITGGGSIDHIFGGSGADTFLFKVSSAFSNIDFIKDFSTSDSDIIDIADVLTGYDPVTDLITDFVEITDNGTDSFLAVDTDGGANNFVQIAQINNMTGLTDEEALETAGTLITV